MRPVGGIHNSTNWELQKCSFRVRPHLGIAVVPEFYDQLTHYMEDQSVRASADDSAPRRAVGFTMAMLQRRMASTIYAVRRNLERMPDRRVKILADPDKHRRDRRPL